MATLKPEVRQKIENLIKINTDLKNQADTAITKWTGKLQAQPAKPSTPKQPDPSVTADPSATGAPTTAQTEIERKHLSLLKQCGFITK